MQGTGIPITGGVSPSLYKWCRDLQLANESTELKEAEDMHSRCRCLRDILGFTQWDRKRNEDIRTENDRSATR